jgi:hypothetical protein
MLNPSFEVTIIDLWPKIKILVKSGTRVVEAGPYQYDIALSQFTPTLSTALRVAVEQVINSHTRR